MKLVSPKRYIEINHATWLTAIIFWFFVIQTFFVGTLLFFVALNYFTICLLEDWKWLNNKVERWAKNSVKKLERKKDLCNRITKFVHGRDHED